MRFLLVMALLAGLAASAQAQEQEQAQDSGSLDLTVNGVGLSIGDSRGVTGLRMAAARELELRLTGGRHATAPERTSNVLT